MGRARLYTLPPGRIGTNHGLTFFDEMVRVPLIINQPGVIRPSAISEYPARAVMYDHDGRVVWDLTLPSDYGFYRAQRIPTPPLVEPIE